MAALMAWMPSYRQQRMALATELRQRQQEEDEARDFLAEAFAELKRLEIARELHLTAAKQEAARKAEANAEEAEARRRPA